jgi:hypothetical protein
MNKNRGFSAVLMLVFLVTVLVALPASARNRTTQSGGGDKGKQGTLDAPIVGCSVSSGTSITVAVTAGASGAPAGFSLHWMLKSDYDRVGWNEYSDSFCAGSFSGNASGGYYNLDLAPDQTRLVTIGGDPFEIPGASSDCDESSELGCGQEYVFRAFAHATSSMFKSDWSNTTTCSTAPCGDDDCTFSQGYWKNHTSEWPVSSLYLGDTEYDADELLSILNEPTRGNGLISLATQLIAAKLNAANGADVSAVATAIAQADALIGDKVVPPVGSDSLASSVTDSLTSLLDDYNTGLIGPGHCD